MNTDHYNSSEEIPKLKSSEVDQYIPAGVSVRFCAGFVDGIVVSLMLTPVTLIHNFMFGKEVNAASLLLNFLYWILYLAITIWFINKKGGLPGKLLLNLKVVDVRTGLYLSPWAVIKREILGKMLCTFTLGIGFLIVPFRSDKRGLHDFIGRSQVLKKIT